jgi:protein SFI1
VIRAANWGERWDAFKRSRIESDALEDVKYYEKSAVRSKATQNTKNFVLQGISDDLSRSRIAETRARVPFLASASSDLDEAFGDETYDGDAESIVGALRPSPRKSMGDKRIRDSRSMVGYTPSQSLDYGYDSISLNPPARTSTPINAQATKGGLFGLDVKDPPLPPYSVSDVSERIDNLSLKPESPSTPKAAPLSWEGYKEDEDTLREMENRADEFYRTGLMGRCWDVWHESYDWVKVGGVCSVLSWYFRLISNQQTTGQIDTVRSTILLRQTLLKWKSEHDRILALPGTADAHHRSHLLSTKFDLWATKLKKRENARRLAAYLARKDSERLEQSWTKWRQDLVQRRTTRWERDMKQREKAFVKASSSRKLANTFDVSIA